FGVVRSGAFGGEVRAEALRGLAVMNDARFSDALKLAQVDANETLRKEATRLQTRTGGAEAVTQLAAVLDKGSMAEKQIALAAVATLDGSVADEIILQWL